MADDTTDPSAAADEEMETAAVNMANTRDFSELADAATARLLSAVKNLGGASMTLGSNVGATSDAFDRTITQAQVGFEKIKKAHKGVEDSAGGLDLSSSMTAGNAGAAGLGKVLDNLQRTVQDNAGLMNSALKGVGGVGIAQLKEGFTKLAMEKTGLGNLQGKLVELEKASLKAGLGMGMGFKDASGATKGYIATMADSIRSTKATEEEIAGIRATLSSAFNTEEMVTSLQGLAHAQGAVRGAVSLTNSAVQLGAATGMESSEVATMMADAHQTLGESISGAAEMFGTIGLAAEGSSLKFGKVAESIKKSAESLAMWGGGVKSAAPMFKAFTNSLDDGRKGLAAPLSQNFTDGLQKMEFGMKSFIATQSGLGKGKGAIGAGLEYEAALADPSGKGMTDISKGLMETLKAKGGGEEIITREMAIENPELERSFMVQRGLLKQMIGGDDANASETLKMLNLMQKDGASLEGDSKEKFKKLIGTGEKTKDATVTAIEKAAMDTQAATVGGSLTIVAAMGQISKAMGLGGMESAISDAAEALQNGADFGDVTKDLMAQITGGMKTAAGGGKAKAQTAKVQEQAQRKAQGMTGRQTRRAAMAAAKGGGGSEEATRVSLQGIAASMKAAQQGKGLNKEERKELKQTGQVPESAINRMYMEQRKPMSKRAAALSRKQKVARDEGKDLSPELQAEYDNLTTTLQALNSSKATLNRKSADGGQEKYLSQIGSGIGPTQGDEPSLAQTKTRRKAAVATLSPKKAAALKHKGSGDIEFGENLGEGYATAKSKKEVRQMTRNAAKEQKQLPVNEAADAAGAAKKEERANFKFTSEPIEQEINLSISQDTEYIKIKVEDDNVKKIVRNMITTGAGQ